MEVQKMHAVFLVAKHTQTLDIFMPKGYIKMYQFLQMAKQALSSESDYEKIGLMDRSRTASLKREIKRFLLSDPTSWCCQASGSANI